jgi:hypothetical protein
MFRRRLALALLALVSASAEGAGTSSSDSAIGTVGAPPGFDELSRPREILVDLYFGGRRIGEAIAVASPGTLRFRDAARVVAAVPNVITSPKLVHALSGDLPSNGALVCPDSVSSGCGRLSPDVAGIIFDEDHYRVDLFVNPAFLEAVQVEQQAYLPTPTAPLSLTSSMGLAVSGSTASSPSYNFQNRTIVGFHNARIRSDSSYASHLGLIVDDLVAEVDRPDLRYSAGLFWAPGLDLTGQRRIVGVGVGTQFDTRADRDSLRGTPLILFLTQPARVETLIDGRLIGSRAYEAGNNVLDTAGLPDGSYPLLLRIHEASGVVREERRFFVKNAQIAPVGQPLYFAYAGMLANTRRYRPISFSDTFFYQAGTARRLHQAFAVDVSVLGTQKKTMAELGGWLITPFARVRAAGLLSTQGDKAALLQAGSSGRGRLNLNFDLRRIWSHDGQPLIPLPTYLSSFGSTPPVGAQIGGSYTQASGSFGYRFGDASINLIGSYRKDKGVTSDYAIGPSLLWPILNRQGLQLTVEANAQRTRTTTAGFVGFKMLFTSGRFSMFSTTGHGGLRSRDGSGRSSSRAVTNVSGQYFHEAGDRTQLSLGAGFDRNIDSTTAQANATLYSRWGSARGDILRGFEGRGGTQYGLSLQTGAAVNHDAVAIGGRDLAESALVAALDGANDGSVFEVLVDEQPRGRLTAGRRLPLFLSPYRAYKVRLRPVNAASGWYDTAAREITLYPGNVEHVSWRVEKLFTVFGQAVRADGTPVPGAMVQSHRGVGQSDERGYFQIEVGEHETLAFTGGQGGPCEVRIPSVTPHDDYASLGKVICR